MDSCVDRNHPGHHLLHAAIGMKIYFAGSIRGGRKNASVYRSLIAYLSGFGEVLTEHVGDASISEEGNDGPDDRYIHDRDMAWLSGCDFMVAEVSVPSLGVGYELGCAVALEKPILCLYAAESERMLSAMIAGSPGIRTAVYASVDDAKKIMSGFLKSNS
jgi:2'-deoxynucleoside 5'-phosphate N-hydrolase